MLGRLIYTESFFLLFTTIHMKIKFNLQLTLPLRCLHGEVKPNSHWDPLLDGLLQAQNLPTQITFFLFSILN